MLSARLQKRLNSCNLCRVLESFISSNQFLSLQVQSQDGVEFAPQVSATCKGGAMNIKILFNSPYSGAVHARDFRTPSCMTFGNGTNIVTMSLNLLSKQGSSEYCGILVSNVSGDVSLTNLILIELMICVGENSLMKFELFKSHGKFSKFP